MAEIVTQRARSNVLLALCRLVLFFSWGVVVHFSYRIVRLITRDLVARKRLAVRWKKFWLVPIMRIWGVKVTVLGSPPQAPVILAPKHNGYLDILLCLGLPVPPIFIVQYSVVLGVLSC